MSALRLILAAAAVAYSVSQYWQEHRRLAHMQKLDGRKAMVRHEALRKRAERNLTLGTAVICALAAAIAIYAFAVLPAPPSKGGL